MSTQHARLSASGAKKWLNCPLSVKLEEKIPNEDTVYAQEGTKAHEIGEYKIKRAINPDTPFEYKDCDAEMDQYTDYYRDCVLEALSKYERTIINLETRVDFSKWVPEGFGTADVIILAVDTLEIIDLKYGKGVRVAAENNPQLMLYALGVVNDFGYLWDVKRVIMTIIQPRIDNISSWEITVEELLAWGDEISEKAVKAYKGEGECVTGTHCDDGFCRARPICKAYADRQLALAKYEFAEPEELSDSDIAHILNRIDELIKWGKSVKDYALKQALSGVKYEGYKLVAGRSNRTYAADASKIVEILKGGGYTEADIYETSLRSVSSLEKTIGKRKFKELLGQYIIKPEGKPTLVGIDDSRPEYNSAENDFKNV